MTVPVAATIAGSDSGGGAGIQADLKAFAACGVFGCTVVTAITAQNTVSVRRVEVVSTAMVAAQIDAVAEDFAPAAWKTGMLATASIVEVVADRLRRLGAPLVVDPVMVAKSGDRLLADDAVDALRRLLLLAEVVTPNALEAEVLLGGAAVTSANRRERARQLADLGPRIVVLKGGHLADGDAVVDVVVDRDSGDVLELAHPRLETTATHGTGCTLSAAIAAFLARGAAPLDAVVSARAYLQRALERAPGVGHGHGPLGHVDLGVAAPLLRAPTRV